LVFEITLGAAMIVLTTAIQVAFALKGVSVLRYCLDAKGDLHHMQLTVFLAAFVLWLFLAAIVQASAWAILYVAVEALPTYEEALYFSIVTYSTLGYGDIVLEKEWRLLSALESANGLIMFGWTTAMVFVAVQWVYGHTVPRERHRKGQ
jgi:ion channel